MRPGPLALEIPAGSPAPQSSSWTQKGGGTLMFCLRSLKKKCYLYIGIERRIIEIHTYINTYVRPFT